MKNHVEVNSNSIKKYIEKQTNVVKVPLYHSNQPKKTTCEPSAISSFDFPLTNQFKK